MSNWAVKVKVKVAPSYPTLCDLMDLQSMEFSRPEYLSEYPIPSPGDIPTPGIELRSPTLQADSLPAEPQGKPKKTGMGSLSVLQQISPTQELNRGLLHCRQIPYKPSYQESHEWLPISKHRLVHCRLPQAALKIKIHQAHVSNQKPECYFKEVVLGSRKGLDHRRV